MLASNCITFKNKLLSLDVFQVGVTGKFGTQTEPEKEHQRPSTVGADLERRGNNLQPPNSWHTHTMCVFVRAPVTSRNSQYFMQIWEHSRHTARDMC